jgi:hypothetical protein
MLAEEIVFVTGCQRGVAIRRSDHPELVRIRPGLFFDRQAALQCLTQIFASQHGISLGAREREVADFPSVDPEIRKFIVGGKERMGLAVPLDLRYFHNRLMLRAPPRIFGGHRPAAGIRHFEHQSVGQVRIMRNGQNLAAGRLLIGVHIVEQSANRGGQTGIGQNLGRPLDTVAKHDHAVQIVAVRLEGIFKSSERGEGAGLVIAVERPELRVPDVGCSLFLAHGVHHCLWQGARASCGDQFCGRACRLLRGFVHHVIPATQRFIADSDARRIVNSPHHTKPVAVIGNHQKIERAGKLRLDPGGGGNFITAREFQRIFGAEPNAKAECIDGIVGMQMGVAPQDGFRIFGQGNRRLCIHHFSGVDNFRPAQPIGACSKNYRGRAD